MTALTSTAREWPLAGLPLPEPVEEDRGFWEGCARGQLAIQRCRSCSSVQHPPEVLCRRCQGFALDWKPVIPRGRVRTHATVHHPPAPAARGSVPYTLLEVVLEAEPAICFHGVLAGGQMVAIGDAVGAVFLDAGGMLLPAWLPADAAGEAGLSGNDATDARVACGNPEGGLR